MMTKLKRAALPLIAAILLIPSLCAHAAGKEKDKQINILCIGNSFTRDAIFHVPALMKNTGVDNVEITFAYYPGRRMAQHCDWSKKDYTIYLASPGSDKWVTLTGSRAKDKAEIPLEQICRSKEWDIITLQEYTGSPDAWEWNEKEKSYFTGMFDQINACLTKKPVYYYILTQAFYDMKRYKKGTISWGQHETARMFNVCADAARHIMADFPAFKGIVSTGAAVENLRTTKLMNEEWGLSRDGFHLDYGVARCTAACTFFETVITPLCHKKLNGVKFTYSDQPTMDFCTPVTEENFPLCLKAARAAIRKPWSVTKIK